MGPESRQSDGGSRGAENAPVLLWGKLAGFLVVITNFFGGLLTV